MLIDEYQKTTAETAIYPGCGTCSQDAIEYAVIGMAGESGEALEFIKKLKRGDFSEPGGGLVYKPHIHPMFVNGLRRELGDVMWYWCRAVEELGFSASEILQDNLNKLADRAARGVIQGSGNSR